MGSNSSAADVQAVLDGIRRIVQALRESSRDSERRTGLTSAQLFVLRRLSENGGLSVNALAARTFTHQSSVSVVVSRLVDAGLVERRPDPDDARRRVLRLTSKGRRALTASPAAAQERLVTAVAALPAARRRETGRALATLADAMAAGRRPGMFFEEGGRA